MSNQTFKKGDRVFHIQYGWGIIEGDKFNIYVKFDNKNLAIMYISENNILSFTEYTLQGFSQERPEELPKKGQIVWVRDDEKHFWIVSHFIKKSNNIYIAANNNPFTYNPTEYDEWKFMTTTNPYTNEK